MLEQYLGAETFRKGISFYIKKHEYGNTETTDLWDAIETSTNQPVRAMMDTWVYQPGYPLITAAADEKNITLQQEPFLIIWLLAQLIAVTACLLQIYGALTALQKQKYRPYTIMLLAIAAYFLIMNGPFGNPRYAMPLTPVFIILTASGILALKKQFVHLFNCSSNTRPGSNP